MPCAFFYSEVGGEGSLLGFLGSQQPGPQLVGTEHGLGVVPEL